MTKPAPRPEASLIRLAREAAGLSPEKAAKRMSVQFSGSRWRQIEAGYRSDSDREVVAKAPTLAHMAHAVGVSAARLAGTGREDAAAILREIEQPGSDTPLGSPHMPEQLAALKDWQLQAILNILDESPRSKREKALLLRKVVTDLEQEAAQEGEPELHRTTDN